MLDHILLFHKARFIEIVRYKLTFVSGATIFEPQIKLRALIVFVTYFILILISVVLSRRKSMKDPRYLNSFIKDIKLLLSLIINFSILEAVV